MRRAIQAKSEAGFSLIELLISMLILIPVMAAAASMFSVGVNQQVTEQGSINVNQEARAGLEMMTREIGMAGAHGDVRTNATAAITSSSDPQTLVVGSTVGMMVGDWVDVGAGTNWESVQLTAVTSHGITGVFTAAHGNNASVNLFALPYVSGVIPPAGMASDSSSNVTTLRFFGDIDGDLILDYVEYAYDSANNQITRSVTPIIAGSKNAALPFINNIRANSAQFIVNTDALGVITSVNIEFTVENAVQTNSQIQHTTLSSRVLIPSAIAGSALLYELQEFQGINKLPQTPPQVIAWAAQGET